MCVCVGNHGLFLQMFKIDCCFIFLLAACLINGFKRFLTLKTVGVKMCHYNHFSHENVALCKYIRQHWYVQNTLLPNKISRGHKNECCFEK